MIVSARHPQEAQGLFQLAFDTAMANELWTLASSILGQLFDGASRRDQYADSIRHLDEMVRSREGSVIGSTSGLR